MPEEITTAITLFTKRPRKDGTCRVQLRVTYNRYAKYYATTAILTPEDFERMNGPKTRGELKELRINLTSLEERAVDIIKSLDRFSFDAFEKKFLKARETGNSITELYEEYISQKLEDGLLSTAANYKSSITSLKQFCPGLEFADLTPSFLKRYEAWLLERGRSVSTVGFYLRPLRAIVNLAIERKAVLPEQNPFGKRKYIIPATRNIKQALDMPDIMKLWEYKSGPGSPEAYWKDLWFFSYLSNGMNITDIANLRYKNIHSDHFEFVRQKTRESTRGNQHPIIVALTEHNRGIITRWANKYRSPDDYVFPILFTGIDRKQQFRNINQATKSMVKYMNRVAAKVGVAAHISTKTARHSYSTAMMRSGRSVEFISKNLGHSSTEVTKHYLGSFDLEELRRSSIELLK
jgi:integrase/recombinase XerD